MSNSKRRIAVIVVNFWKARRIVESIRSLREQTIGHRLNIVVIENTVDPGEIDLLRAELRGDEKLIIPTCNLGYSRGVNLAAQNAAPFDDVLLLNPDIIVDDSRSLELLESQMLDDPSIGVLAALQRNDDGSVVEVARNFPTLSGQIMRRLQPGSLTEYDLVQPLLGTETAMVDVDWVQSSFTLVKGELWRSIGGLNQRYKIFMSDVELSEVAHRYGLRVAVTNATTVRADGKRASAGGIGDIFSNYVLRTHVRDALFYHTSRKLRISRPRTRQEHDIPSAVAYTR